MTSQFDLFHMFTRTAARRQLDSGSASERVGGVLARVPAHVGVGGVGVVRAPARPGARAAPRRAPRAAARARATTCSDRARAITSCYVRA